MRRIVCQCNKVTEEYVREFLSVYPDMPHETAKIAMNIGTRCMGCQVPNSNIVDITFEEIVNSKNH